MSDQTEVPPTTTPDPAPWASLPLADGALLTLPRQPVLRDLERAYVALGNAPDSTISISVALVAQVGLWGGQRRAYERLQHELPAADAWAIHLWVQTGYGRATPAPLST